MTGKEENIVPSKRRIQRILIPIMASKMRTKPLRRRKGNIGGAGTKRIEFRQRKRNDAKKRRK